MIAGARFDGWRIVALGGALIWLGPGLLETYAFLATPLAAEFGLSSEGFGTGMALMILALALPGPAIGALLDSGPLRPVLLGAIGIAACALWAASRAESAGALAAAGVVAALGVCTYGQIGPQVMVAGWFVRMRSRAIALASLGTSCAGITIPLIAQELIARFGWRGALLGFGAAVALLLGPAVAWLAVKRPADVGQVADGDPPGGEDFSGSVEPVARESMGALLRDPNFWVLGASIAVATSAALCGVFLVKHMENVGIAPADARWVPSLMSAGAFLGRLCTGWLHERFPKPLVAAAVFALSGLGWVGVAQARDLSAFLWIALPAGFAAGGFGVSAPVLQVACFGPNVLGRVMGAHGLLGLPFLLAAPPLVGRGADAAGSFAPAFMLLALAMVGAAAAMVFVRAPARR